MTQGRIRRRKELERVAAHFGLCWLDIGLWAHGNRSYRITFGGCWNVIDRATLRPV